MESGATHVPVDVGAGRRVYVTLFGTEKPPGTGPIRIDFGVPHAALHVAGRSDWRQLLQNLANVPIYNVTIHVPSAIAAEKILGR